MSVNVVVVEVLPSAKVPQEVDSQARLLILPELSMTTMMFGVVALETKGGTAV
ncbi:MAG: hypothetical protein AMXMBFR67_18350 [Nitrospira sp.]